MDAKTEVAIYKCMAQNRESDICESCRKNEGTDKLHSCPFAEEIWDNHSADCNCCDDCSYQCAMDI